MRVLIRVSLLLLNVKFCNTRVHHYPPPRIVAMAREYIARDPKTGNPINVGSGYRKKKKKPTEIGPWMALPNDAVIPLAKGEIETYRVSWKDRVHHLGKLDAIKALSKLSGMMAHMGHGLLLDLLMDSDPNIRSAALFALPLVAETKPDELFDHLSVLLDDKDLQVRMAASKCLERVAPVFPSATESTLAFELRHSNNSRRESAFRGLGELCYSWPEVACDHIDELLQEEELVLRRSAAKLLRKVLAKGGAASWDLIGWAIEDEDVITRREAAKCLTTLAKREQRIATILAEKAILDTDTDVMVAAIRCIEMLDTDNNRVRDLVLAGCTHKQSNVRLACVKILPRLMGDEILRNHCNALLREEKDPRIRRELEEMAFDMQMEGSEEQKNRYLAPAPKVPQIDREIAESQGKTVGLEELPDPDSNKKNPRHD